ncbi:MAG: NifU family protein [Bacilli bacterium]|nr:NifU family protein [bacterium]MBQ9853654.1 NifU family protein [Bacilli bacterium]
MDTESKIKEIIEKIKPILQNDGGDIEFVKYENGIVYVSITGVCMHCHMLEYTLEGIENSIKEEIDEVKKVELA